MKQNENKERPGRSSGRTVCRGRIAGLRPEEEKLGMCHDEQEEAQQIEKEMQVYLEEYSDPTLYLTPKEVKAWNRMSKSKQKRLLERRILRKVLQAWKAGARKVSAGGARKVDSMEDLVFLQVKGTKSGTPLHRIWKPEKARKKVFGEERPTVPHNPQRHSSPNAKQTQAKTGKQVAEGVQSAAASVAGSASTVTPATLATRTAKKTAQTFKHYVQEVNQAAQQAIGEERAKLEDTKQQNAQVGDLPSFVKYLGATIGSVVLAGWRQWLHAAGGGTFDRAGDHAGLSVGGGIGNLPDCQCDPVPDRWLPRSSRQRDMDCHRLLRKI